jgi:hypothetical protein
LNTTKEALEGALDFMELHKKHWPGWEGETEVRQLGPEDFAQSIGIRVDSEVRHSSHSRVGNSTCSEAPQCSAEPNFKRRDRYEISEHL